MGWAGAMTLAAPSPGRKEPKDPKDSDWSIRRRQRHRAVAAFVKEPKFGDQLSEVGRLHYPNRISI
jgi:hypothetical protein